MEALESQIAINKATIESSNLCNHFTQEDLDKIGLWVYECYERDVDSRKDWFRRNEAAMDLAMQIQKDKSFPWANCSNVKFPLVTIAALQFHARAYPSIVNGRSVVQCRVIGQDTPEGILKARAGRISEHMSWQLLEQDESWEEQQDRALLNVPIVGTAWKKSYYDASKGHNISTLVLAKDLVLDYWAKSVDSCPTKTHIIPLYRNDMYERVRRGQYVDILDKEWYKADATIISTQKTLNEDNRAGKEAPQSNHNTPFTLLEQHCDLDLDGDGYAEPYIVTIEESSRSVLRIVTRFEREEDVIRDAQKRIVRINAIEYFTKIPFIPSPDGGIMDIGFGTLLGPLNESVNSAINQLFDAGTVSNTAGGFLGRGAKIRGGVYEFKPFGWNRVDATGDDLRKNIFPLPVREPSAVLFNLLNLLIEYSNKVSGATDMLTGVNPGQNTPAETSRAMVEQGQKVYSAIFKRIWRSLKQEFKKLYILNAINLPSRTPFGGTGSFVLREDYDCGTIGVVPVADPTITSDAARFAQATMIAERAAANPGYDVDAVEELYLKAMGVDQPKTLYPGQKNMPEPPPDVKIQLQQMKNEVAAGELEFKKFQFIHTMQEMRRLNTAKITELEAKAFKMEEEGKGEKDDKKINAFRAGIEAMREQSTQLDAQISKMIKESSNGSNEDVGAGRTVSPVEATSSDGAAANFAGFEAGGTEGGMG